MNRYPDYQDVALLPAQLGMPGGGAAPEPEGLSLTQLKLMLRAHPRASAIIAAVVMLFTVLLLVVLPRTYTANAMLMVNYQVNDPTNGHELQGMQVTSFIATQVELMRTRDVLLEVVKRLNLTSIRGYASGYARGEGSLEEWVAGKINAKLDIRPSATGSQLIYVSFSASKPELAANVVNTLTDVYREQERNREVGAPEEQAQRSEAEITALKARVEEARRKLDEFQQKNGIIIDDAIKSDVDTTALDNLEGRLLEAQNMRRLAELRAHSDASTSDQALSSPVTQGLRTQLAAKEAQLAQMSRTYGSAYPGLAEAQQQVSDLRSQLAQAEHAFTSNANSAASSARDLEAKLSSDVASQRARVANLGRLHTDATQLKVEFDSAQEAYKKALDNRGAVAAISAAKPNSNVEEVSRATPPMSASAPKFMVLILAGLVGSVVLGLGLPLAYEFMHRKVRCSDDIERSFGIPVIGEFRLTNKEIVS